MAGYWEIRRTSTVEQVFSIDEVEADRILGIGWEHRLSEHEAIERLISEREPDDEAWMDGDADITYGEGDK